MKKFLFGVAFLGGLLGTAIWLNEGSISSVDLRPIRLPCGKVTDDLCPGGVNKLGDYCLCYTLEKAGDVPDEVTADKIPILDRVKIVLCCDWFDPELKKTRHVIRRVKGPVPVGCQSLTDNIALDASSNNVWLPIDDVMSAACCADCPEDCWIKSGKHGQCPYCICDATCGKHCPKEKTP